MGASFPPSWDSRFGEASAVERYVALNGTNDGTGGYITWSGASTNIQDAVNKCSNNDVVWVTNGTYYCWSNSAYAGYTSMVTVARASNITIQSMNGPAVTIVDANYPNFTNRCFYITSNATVSGFTITNGHACDVATAGGGGGVFINTSGRVTNCWITGNTTTNGIPSDTQNGAGGVRCKGGGEMVNCLIYANSSTGGNNTAGVYAYEAGTYVIRDCIISNNSNSGVYFYNAVTVVSISNSTFINNNGSGLLLWTSGPWTIDNCKFIGNTGRGFVTTLGDGNTRNCQMINNAGGGVSLSVGVLSNCVVSSNYAASGYGGVSIGGNSTLVIDCTIVSNYVPNGGSSAGGGVKLSAGTLRNCLIANNRATYGAGVYISVVTINTARLENCTIVSNSSYGSDYGGIYNAANTGTGVVVNTICYSNFAGTIPNNWKNLGCLVFYNSCTTPTNDLLGSNNITNEPAFVNIATRNYRLSRSSPCINTGSNMNWMIGAGDLDGRMRIRYGTVDMGAYETIFGGTYYKFH